MYFTVYYINEETICLFGGCLFDNRLCGQSTGSRQYCAIAEVILGGCEQFWNN